MFEVNHRASRFAILAALLTMPQLVVAQVDSTLQSLTRMALERNPEIQAKFRSYLAAEQRGAQVGALPDPEIMFQWFANPAQAGNPLRRSAFGVRQMMPWPGTLAAERTGAAAGARARWHALDVARVELSLSVAETWHARHGQARRIALTREHLTWIARLEALARQRHELGLVSQAELLRIELEREQMRSQLRVMELEARALDVRLRSLLNATPEDDIPLPNGAQPNLAFVSDSLDASHPMLLEATSMIDESEAMSRRAALANRPMIGFGLDVMGPEFSMMRSSFAWPIVPSVSVTLPIWRSKTRAIRQEASIRNEEATFRLDAVALGLSAERDETRLMLSQAEEMVTLYRTRLIPRSIELADLVLLEYSTGKRSANEVIEVRRLSLDYSMMLESAITERNTVIEQLRSLYPNQEN